MPGYEPPASRLFHGTSTMVSWWMLSGPSQSSSSASARLLSPASVAARSDASALETIAIVIGDRAADS